MMNRVFTLFFIAAIYLCGLSISPATIIVGSIHDVMDVPFGGQFNTMQFTPLSCPQQIGSNTYWPQMRQGKLTNGLFRVNLVAGAYYAGLIGDAAYNQAPKTIKIIVPPNETNVLQFNYCATLATNVGSFIFTNGLYNLQAGDNISFTTNSSNALKINAVANTNALTASQAAIVTFAATNLVEGNSNSLINHTITVNTNYASLNDVIGATNSLGTMARSSTNDYIANGQEGVILNSATFSNALTSSSYGIVLNDDGSGYFASGAINWENGGVMFWANTNGVGRIVEIDKTNGFVGRGQFTGTFAGGTFAGDGSALTNLNAATKAEATNAALAVAPIVAQGANVTVTPTTNGHRVTYTVASTGGGTNSGIDAATATNIANTVVNANTNGFITVSGVPLQAGISNAYVHIKETRETAGVPIVLTSTNIVPYNGKHITVIAGNPLVTSTDGAFEGLRNGYQVENNGAGIDQMMIIKVVSTNAAYCYVIGQGKADLPSVSATNTDLYRIRPPMMTWSDDTIGQINYGGFLDDNGMMWFASIGDQGMVNFLDYDSGNHSFIGMQTGGSIGVPASETLLAFGNQKTNTANTPTQFYVHTGAPNESLGVIKDGTVAIQYGITNRQGGVINLNGNVHVNGNAVSNCAFVSTNRFLPYGLANGGGLTNLNAGQLVGSIHTNNLPTNNVTFLSGTYSGTHIGDGSGLYSDNLATNQNQIPNLEQVINLLTANNVCWFSTNQANGWALGTSRTNYALHSAPLAQSSYTVAGVTNGQYIGAFVCSNSVADIRAGAGIATVFASINTGGGRSASLAAEMYVANSVNKTLEYEFLPSPLGQSLSGATNVSYIYSIPLTEYNTGTNVHMVCRLKIITQTANPDVTIYCGNGTASHIEYNSATSGGTGDVTAAGNNVFTGANTFGQPVSVTNALVIQGSNSLPITFSNIITSGIGQANVYVNTNLALSLFGNGNTTIAQTLTATKLNIPNSINQTLPYDGTATNFVLNPDMMGNINKTWICTLVTNSTWTLTNATANTDFCFETVQAGVSTFTLTYSTNYVAGLCQLQPPTAGQIVTHPTGAGGRMLWSVHVWSTGTNATVWQLPMQ